MLLDVLVGMLTDREALVLLYRTSQTFAESTTGVRSGVAHIIDEIFASIDQVVVLHHEVLKELKVAECDGLQKLGDIAVCDLQLGPEQMRLVSRFS